MWGPSGTLWEPFFLTDHTCWELFFVTDLACWELFVILLLILLAGNYFFLTNLTCWELFFSFSDLSSGSVTLLHFLHASAADGCVSAG